MKKTIVGDHAKLVIPIQDAWTDINTLMKNGSLEAALVAVKRALDDFDRDECFLNQKGLILRRMARYEEAVPIFLEAIEKTNDMVRSAPAMINLGMCYRLMFKPANALIWLHTAFSRCADVSKYDAGLALSGCFFELGRFGDSVTLSRQLIALAPSRWEAHVHLSNSLLALGEWKAGFEEWKWRVQEGEWPVHYGSFRCPRWQGEPLAGKKIIVWTEQGLGDEILMVSMLPGLINVTNPASVTLMCSKRALPVFARAFSGVDKVSVLIRKPKDHEDADFNIGFAELAQFLTSRFNPSEIPYLGVYMGRNEAVRYGVRLALGVKPEEKLVGISWNSPNPESGRGKSMNLPQFKKLDVPGIKLVSLQYGPHRALKEVIKQSGVRVFDYNLSDTSFLMDYHDILTACDYVVTVSNTVAHLAGASGVPAFVFVPEGLGRFWYWSHQTPQGRSLFYSSVSILPHNAGDPSVASAGFDKILEKIL